MAGRRPQRSTKSSEYRRLIAALGIGERPTRLSSMEALVVRRIRRGFPVSVISKTASYFDLTSDEVERLVGVTSRKIAWMRKRRSRLTAIESDRLYRFVRIGLLAQDLLMTRENTNRWLRRPAKALGQVAPLDLLDTDAGAQLVERLIGRLEHGIIT